MQSNIPEPWSTSSTDDFMIRPGQTWCVITSAVEGDTHVTVYAPEIHDWDHHKVFVTKHWVDAEWRLPPPAINRAGTEHVFTTQIFRHTDRGGEGGPPSTPARVVATIRDVGDSSVSFCFTSTGIGLPDDGSVKLWTVVMTSVPSSHAVVDRCTCTPWPIITVLLVSDPSSA